MKILIEGGGNMGTMYAQAFINMHTVAKTKLYLLEHKYSASVRNLELKFHQNLMIKQNEVEQLYSK